jgi:DNA end-binding protein Ku
VKPEQMRLIGDLIKSRKKAWNPVMVADPVQKRLLDVIAAKKRGAARARKPVGQPEPAPRKLTNIMDALRRSMAATKKPKRSSEHPPKRRAG